MKSRKEEIKTSSLRYIQHTYKKDSIVLKQKFPDNQRLKGDMVKADCRKYWKKAGENFTRLLPHSCQRVHLA
jgi:hypothetical protein